MAENRTILLVDDTPSDLKLIGDRLQEEGYDLLISTSGIDAIRITQSSLPTLILLDLGLPDLDGISVCQQLKTNPATSFIPILIVSAEERSTNKVKGLQAGAVDFISKPYQTDEVLARIKTHLKLIHVDELKSELEAHQTVIDALRKSQKMAHIGTWNWHIQKDFLEWSDEMYHIFGIDPNQFRGKLSEVIQSSIHPEDLERVNESNKSVVEKGIPIPVEYRIIRPNGEIRVVWGEAGELIKDSSNTPILLSGIVQDITDRKSTEADLLSSQESYKTLLNTSMDGFLRIDFQGKILEVNETACKLYEYSSAEFLGLRISDIYAAMTPENVTKRIHKTFEMEYSRFETKHRSKSGRIFDVEVSTQICGTDRKEVAIFLRDISHRIETEHQNASLQSQLAQAQKLESIGRLAGGVAHDFNNMLGVIRGHADFALGNTDERDPLYEDLSEILKAAKRAGELTRQLLAFARKEVISPKVLDVNETIEGMLKMLQRLIGEDIRIDWQPSLDIGSLFIDPSQIDQILANLCVNARDAIENTGAITISTQNVLSKDFLKPVETHNLSEKFVKISVKDTGCGMDKLTKTQIFEPFFTTKGQGKGTGLGLATVYGIIKQNYGYIMVDSDVGSGTTFSIFLPRYEGQIQEMKQEELHSLPIQGTETILIVEDETAILEMTQMFLETQGYHVIACDSTEEAISIVKKKGITIDLLITDVIMPEMNGKELSERIQESLPDIKHLFMSGYTADIIATRGISDDAENFLQKPFSPNDLYRKVEGLLHSGKS